jgi:ATP-binding cassette subfamily C (CFTR/MRP) protein 4
MVFLEQTLRLSQDSLSTSNIGQITNFISNDVNRFDRYMIFMPYLFVAPIQLVVVTAVLYYSMGVSSFAGVSILILLAPMQGKGV